MIAFLRQNLIELYSIIRFVNKFQIVSATISELLSWVAQRAFVISDITHSGCLG